MIRALTHRTWMHWGIVLLLIMVGMFAVAVSGASAQVPQDTLGLNTFEQTTSLGGQDIRITVARIINVFLSVIGTLALIIVLYGGFMYMTAGGNEEQIGRARRILINGGLGLIIIFSSWAITRFVLTRLQNATGTGVPTSTSDSTTRITQQFSCALNPGLCCARDNFIVQSITPRSNAVTMNNGVIRAVFSRSIRPPAAAALQITREGIRVDNEFTIAFADSSQRVVQATYTATSTCATPGCMPIGGYRVTVQDVTDNNGNALQTNTSCGEFRRDATFSVTTNGVVDATQPVLPTGMTLNGVQQQNQPVPIGQFVSTSIPITDNSGAGYLRLVVGPENGAPDVVVYDGPPVARGSDATAANPYVFNYPLTLPRTLRPLQRYVVRADITDIDNNVRTVSSSFVTVADHCFNNRQDGDETGIDIGGSCLSDGACTANWQCASGQCTQGQCLSIPIISRVDPWDGAAGNWVTIIGRFFGDDNGEVAFGFDQNNDGTVTGTEWQATQLAQCGGQDVWRDNWIIAEIPPDAQLPDGRTSSIRVSRANDASQSDTTTNARGPIAGPNNGLFTKNNANTRPGICRVETVATAATAGTPRTPIRVLGQGFGTTANVLSFGGLVIPTGSWTEGVITATVPESLQPGLVGVNVTAGGRVSNGFPFEVLDPGQNLNPVIDTISPAAVTVNSLITISGQGFGNRTGRVFLTTDANATCTPQDVSNDICFQANTTLDAACGDTWSPQQVIAQMTGIDTSAQYFVRLRNGAGFQTTDNDDVVTINATGTPTPGICRINPAQGPAPRGPIQVTGVNFSQPVSAHFWSATAAQNPTNIAAWPVFTTGAQITLNNNRSLATPIPITAGGETMQTGPVYVQTNGGLSNGVDYTVLDCRNVPEDQQPENFQCCSDGSYRPNNQACPGETRDAGYVWRFTTGKTPNFPYVIQQCQNGGASPSPSPSRQWDSGRPACINALLRVRFNLDMDPTSIENGIRVYTCAQGNQPDCRNQVDVTPEFTIAPLARGAEIRANSGQLLSNTWYRVALLNSVQSQRNEVILAQNTIVNEPLRRTNPCSSDTAFCFDFQTDDQLCELANAYMEPPTRQTTYLGMLQDRRHPLNFADPLNVPNPFYFYLWGQADRACVVLPVDGLGWQWGPTAVTTAVTAASAPSVGSRALYTDSRGTAVARQNTAPGTVEIQAVTSTLIATSTITVDLGDPTIVDYWPNCVESCTNANIGVQFSTYMLESTFATALTIQECTDALCTGTTGVNIPFSIVQSTPILFRVAPVQPLIENRWYQVSVDETARAATALGSTVPGNPLTPFRWRFRTKAQDGFCIASQVVVDPNPFTARAIGQKTPYRAIPFSSPNQCNTRGQGLNPWAYGWQWQTLDRAGTPATDVASVTQFQTIAAPKPFCNQGCVPSGSDVRRGQAVPPLCGDGLVDRREDCDIAATFVDSSGATVPEVAGTSCSLTCQRPGSAVATCGDGIVQPEFGEQCDPLDNPTGCSETCQLIGSVPEDRFREVSTNRRSWCGDGVVDAASGEACDINADANNDGVLDEIAGVTCSSQNCLRLGNRLASQDWCTQNETLVVDVADGTQARQTAACLSAVSYCGNGIVENGELCEVVTRDPVTGAGTIRLFGQPGTVAVADTDVCTDRCLLTNVCNENTFPPEFVCTAQEGCRPAECISAGSSLGYTVPSLCGDGVVGTGEFAICEYQPGEYNPTALLGLDPVQIVTAVGQGTVNPNTNLQEASVEARAVQVQRSPTQREAVNVSGLSDYALQCGYTEYPTQRVLNGAPSYNDCPGNANNTEGVGYNSCCYLRASRTREYPADGTGLLGSGTAPVCINTYIDVEYAGNIDAETVKNNVFLAQGFPTQTDCSILDQTDVTNMVTGTIARIDTGSATPDSLFRRLWDGFRGFLRGFFGRGAYATTQRPPIVTWCSGTVNLTPTVTHERVNGQVVSSTIRLAIDKALLENTTYAVVVRGGIQGVRDVRGVGIQPQRAAGTDDSWVFQTDPAGRICEIDTVTIDPPSYVFTRPNSSTLFTASVFDDTGAPLQAVPGVYDWRTAWGPTNHAAFAIPASGPTNTQQIQIGSRTVEGNVTAFANLTITDNLVTRTTGTVFSGTTNLRALFCENLWPPRQYYPYEEGFPRNGGPNNDGYNAAAARFDGSAIPATTINGLDTYFNFSTGYCADSGSQATTTDDLPYLKPLVFTTANARTGTGGTGGTGGNTPPATPAATPGLVAHASLRDGIGGVGARYLDMPTDVFVRDGIAYFIASNRNTVGAIDVSNPAAPRPLPQMEISYPGSGGQALKGAHTFAFSGNTAHVLALGRGEGSYKVIEYVPGANGLRPTPRGELFHSRTGQPHLLGAKDIEVQGNYAYVTVSGFELRSNGLQVIDVSDPGRPVPAGYINHGDQGAQLYGANGLFVRGNYAYITVTGFGIEGLQIIDISDPANLRPVGFLDHSTRAPLVGARDLFVSGDFAYVAVATGGTFSTVPYSGALSIINVSSPTSPEPVAALLHGSQRLGSSNNVVVVNSVAYVSARGSNAVTAIDVSDPANPRNIHSVLQSATPPQMYFDGLADMWVDGGFVYTVSQISNSFEVIDARSITPAPPATPAGRIRLPQESRKQFLFTNPNNNDGVGMQVFDNVARESARRWFEARHGSSENFQDVIVGGFDAISDGSNTYVNFLNQGAVPNDVDSYILLLSINADAQDETRQVYRQLIDNLSFLNNVTDVGYCSVGDNSNPQNVFTADAAASTQCRTDFDCLNINGTNRICANAKTKLLRDWRRVADTQRMQQLLKDVGAGTRFPQLQSGTYYQTYTNSRWPSWNQTLAGQARTPQLPQDPVNQWTACGDRDPQTCWDPERANFVCPEVTSVYEYAAGPDGSSYTLHVPFEYFTPTGGVIDQLLDSNFLSFNRWCQANVVYSPFERTCGDGIVNTTVGPNNEPAEQCDPPGETRLRPATPADGCAPGQQVQESCSASCTFARSQCVTQSVCGNGIVEVGERCDDGEALNGRYGQCAGPNSGTVPACQGPHPAFCGDGIQNFADAAPSDGFRDAGTQSDEYCEITSAQFANQGFCQKRSCLRARFSVEDVSTSLIASNLFSRDVQMIAPNNVWLAGRVSAGGNGRIYQYTGTPARWVRRYEGAFMVNAIFFLNPQLGWAAGSERGSGTATILRTGDAGQSWQQIRVSTANDPLRDVQFISSQIGFVAGDNGIFGSTADGGATWNTLNITGRSLRSLSFVDAQNGWVVGSGGALYATDNGGQSWTSQQQNLPGNIAPNFLSVSFLNRSIGYLLSRNRAVYKTTDGGASWQDLNVSISNRVNIENMDFVDQLTGIVVGQEVTGGGSSPFIYATNDGGVSWSRQDTSGVNVVSSRTIDLFDETNGIIGGFSGQAMLLVADPYCQGVTLCPATACENGDQCAAVNDPSYSFNQGNSCSLDCRAPGGYCGDGIVNQQYEECETNDPNCTSLCLTRTQPQPATPGVIVAGCGNGIVEAGEQCDTGASNGQLCTAGYGQTCTYCSAADPAVPGSGCRVLTRDATAFCGDGVLQRDQGEVCDVGPTPGTILTSDGTATGVTTQQCGGGENVSDRRGGYACVNNCRTIENTCTVCGFIEQCSCDASGNDTGDRPVCRDNRDNDGDGAVDCADTTGGGALPQIAILNPTIGDTEAASYVDTSWGAQTYYDVLRPRLSSLPASTRAQWTVVQGWLGYSLISAPAFPDFRQTRALFAQGRSGPEATGPLRENVLLNTDPLCRDAYYLDINASYVEGGISGAINPSSLFPYPVNGEAGVVRNEVVFSPPVPENVFRVVVRWGADEFNANARFIGRARSIDFAGGNGGIADLTWALASDNVCSNITRQQVTSTLAGAQAQYWWPATGSCLPFSNSVYVHPRLADGTLFNDTFAQAMTIDLRDSSTFDDIVYFFVDELSGPIRPYERNRTVWVDVYEYVVGQNTLQGQYLPAQTFPITAAAGTSSNPTDEFWHVFNLVRNAATGRYSIVPVQSIERDETEVYRNR